MARITYCDAFQAANDSVDFKAYPDRAFGPAILEREGCTVGNHFYFVLDGDTVLGYFKVNEGAAPLDLHDPRALERIYGPAAHQGKGLGAQIPRHVVQWVGEGKKEHIRLGVWQHNPGAIPFYLRHGFQKFGEHPYFIGRDEQTDGLLRLDL